MYKTYTEKGVTYRYNSISLREYWKYDDIEKAVRDFHLNVVEIDCNRSDAIIVWDVLNLRLKFYRFCKVTLHEVNSDSFIIKLQQ